MKKRLILSVMMAAAMAVPANAATINPVEANTVDRTYTIEELWDMWCKKIFGHDVDPSVVEEAFGPADAPIEEGPAVVEEWEDENHVWHTGVKGAGDVKGGTKAPQQVEPGAIKGGQVPQQVAPGASKGGQVPQQVLPDTPNLPDEGQLPQTPQLPDERQPEPTPKLPDERQPRPGGKGVPEAKTPQPQVQEPGTKGGNSKGGNSKGGDTKAPDTKTPDTKGQEQQKPDSKGDTNKPGTEPGTKGGGNSKGDGNSKNPDTKPGGNGDGSGNGNGSGNGSGSGNGNGTNPSNHGRKVIRISGETRFETAIEVSKRTYPNGGAKAVIIARGDVAADSVSAVPLAEAMDAPVLLTQSDALHKATEAEIKRLLPNGGKVVIMGGEEAVSKKVADEVTKLGGQVERIAGMNRAGTAVETANRLHKGGELKELLIADGANWQDDLIAGPAAAEVDGATLLTNGDKMAPETESFLKQHSNLKLTAIGENGVKASKATNKVVGDTPTTLSLNVAKHFFKNPKAVGVATTADFADALAGGALVAEHDGPILLSPQMIPVSLVEYLNAHQSVTTVYVFGGTERFSNEQIALLGK